MSYINVKISTDNEMDRSQSIHVNEVTFAQGHLFANQHGYFLKIVQSLDKLYFSSFIIFTDGMLMLP